MQDTVSSKKRLGFGAYCLILTAYLLIISGA